MSDERLRRCLGCGNLFDSVSPANRFCKKCKKRRHPFDGSLEALDPDLLPLSVAREVKEKYYPGQTPAQLQSYDRRPKLARFGPQKQLMFTSAQATPAWGPAPPTGF